MTHRFVVGPDLALSREQARQIASVLRLGPGDVVTLVSDGEELDYRLDRVAPGAVAGTVVARRAGAPPPRVALTLALPLLRAEHTELVLESATQLGAARFVPYTSARSVARDVGTAKRARWERIVREAIETSRRARVPEIAPLARWSELFGPLPRPVLVAWEGERATSLRDALPREGTLSLVIGPEGGIADDEIALARSAGAVTVSLGAANLRAETAAIAAVAIALAG
ncbi:MAG TPA: RsmE family RNA methyltransferase [Candidatus Limnocylindria bacterium]|nr:RsmE family RNA methyltransferase [Candidatus Limnocylindria bacterium]